MTAAASEAKKLSIDEFLAAYGGREEKFELVDGVPVKMAEANRRHVRIMRNLVRRLAERLEGGPCEVLAAGMGLAVSSDTFRLPDVGIYCDPRDTGHAHVEPMTLNHPKVLIDILSRRTDHAIKVDEYQAIASVDTIVLVHTLRDAFTTHERVSHTEWRTVVHPPGHPLVLRDPPLTVSAEDIFAGTSNVTEA